MPNVDGVAGAINALFASVTDVAELYVAIVPIYCPLNVNNMRPTSVDKKPADAEIAVELVETEVNVFAPDDNTEIPEK